MSADEIRRALEAIREGDSARVAQRHVLRPGANAWSIWDRGECHCGPATWPCRTLDEAVGILAGVERAG